MPATTYERVLLPNLEEDKPQWLDDYKNSGGYAALKQALTMTPEQIVNIVKDSGLRGRGGAGFPTGMKWNFLPKGLFPRYLAINADESEPGTCKDRPLMEQRPHLMIEGIICTLLAIESEWACVYIRGEYYKSAKIVQKAVEECYEAGILGDNVMGSGKKAHIVVHRGAGAYICGEETALLTSLEGFRGYPKLKPPFPAISGLYGKPTIINNVETLANIPLIMTKGVDWFKSYVHEKSTGLRLYSVSGHVKKPGVYELPMSVTMRELVYDYCGGIRNDHDLKFIIPGGSSSQWILPDNIDFPLSVEGVAKAGSMLGSAAIMVFDHTVCPVWAAVNTAAFYRHESCGQCTPCREGSAWMHKIVLRIENGGGTEEDLQTLASIAGNGVPNTGMISGKSICALGDAAAWPIGSALSVFRKEFEEHIHTGHCTYQNKRYWMADGKFVNESFAHHPTWGAHH
ncbi:NADH-quinone oxidoreductase subunit NuoF [soil metagenome]